MLLMSPVGMTITSDMARHLTTKVGYPVWRLGVTATRLGVGLAVTIAVSAGTRVSRKGQWHPCVELSEALRALRVHTEFTF